MFIAFDGIDGVGKNTQVDMLREALKKEGHQVRVLDFGGATEFKQLISDINSRKIIVTPKVREFIYYFEGLYTNINIIQKYSKSEDVIIDRYYLSYYAYGMENGVSYEEIAHLTKNLIEPDLYIYLDGEVSVTKQRIIKERDFDAPEIGFANLGEKQEKAKEKNFLNFQNAVRENYLRLLNDRHICISANQPKEVIHRMVMDEIHKYRK